MLTPDTWGPVTFDSIPLPDVGIGGLLVLFVVAILRGWLVPRRVLEDVRQDRDARLGDRDRTITELHAEVARWQEAYRASDSRGDAMAVALAQLAEQGRTAVQVIRALPDAARAERDGPA
jgi:hypothetical protein